MATRKQELLNKLISSIASVSQVEGEIYNYVEELGTIQDQILDIEHYLEDHVITKDGAVELINILQKLRIERRQIKQMWELWNVYGVSRDKLKQKDYREFLINDLLKKDKDLQTQYKYKQFDEEYLNSLNTVKISKRGRKPKNITYNNIEEEENGKE